jgi:hypothetical protein
MSASNWIALGALVVAILSFVYGIMSKRSVNKQVTEINRRHLEKLDKEAKDENKADIIGEIRKSGERWILCIKNTGKSDARNVKVNVYSPVLRFGIGNGNVINIKSLAPGEEFTCACSLIGSPSNSFDTIFSWDDNFAIGRGKKYAIMAP